MHCDDQARPPYSSGVTKSLHLQWPNTSMCWDLASHCWLPCGGCEVDKVELDTSPLESPFATCPSKEDKARLYSETQELWRMAGSLQGGCLSLRTHPWTWHEGDWPRGITSWEGMQTTVTVQLHLAGSESLLGMQDWGMRGAESLSQERKHCPVSRWWHKEPPWPLTEGGWQGE